MNILSYFPVTKLTPDEMFSLLPLLILAFGGLFCLLAGTNKKNGHNYAFGISFATLIICLFVGSYNIFSTDISLLDGTLLLSPFTKAMSLMVMFFGLVSVVLTYGQDLKEGMLAEVYGLILFSISGMVLMLSTTHLLFTFIALEIMSLAVYVLVSMRRSSRFSSEAGLKYFILGGLGSALLLYGTSLIFGATGSFDLVSIENYLMVNPNPSFLYYIGLGMICASLLFKVGAFPFHGWVPDVYQGASTNITGFMGAAVKFTAFVAFARITQHLVLVDNVAHLEWFKSLIWFVAAASMIYGNFVAISQNELKRMLSFSTIAHTGYLLLGLCSMRLGDESAQSIILYLFFYALSNLGAFAVISLFEERHQKDLTLDQIAGLGAKYPLLAGLFTIFLLSMAGIPLTSGFIGKYGLFSSAVEAGEIPLVVIAVLTSVVSVYYYLRVIVYMFMKESTEAAAKYHNLNGANVVALVTAAATLQFGLFPKSIIYFIKMISK